MSFLLAILKKYQELLTAAGEISSKALNEAIDKLGPKLILSMTAYSGGGTTAGTMTSTDPIPSDIVDALNAGEEASITVPYRGGSLNFLKIDINEGVHSGDKVIMTLDRVPTQPSLNTVSAFNPINGQRIMAADYTDGYSWSMSGGARQCTVTLNYDDSYVWLMIVSQSYAGIAINIKDFKIERAS